MVVLGGLGAGGGCVAEVAEFIVCVGECVQSGGEPRLVGVGVGVGKAGVDRGCLMEGLESGVLAEAWGECGQGVGEAGEVGFRVVMGECSVEGDGVLGAAEAVDAVFEPVVSLCQGGEARGEVRGVLGGVGGVQLLIEGAGLLQTGDRVGVEAEQAGVVVQLGGEVV